MSTGRGWRCLGKACKVQLYGQARYCPACQVKRTLCQETGCGKPHGGIVGQTRYCPPCRSKRRTKPHKPYNPRWTPEEDAIIRDVYAKHHAREAGALLRARVPTRPNWSVKRRAQVLGACTVRKKEPHWTGPEDAILREFAWMCPERLLHKLKEKGFRRTVTGVAIRMKRLRTRELIDGMTATGLAEMLNIDGHAVARWIEEGKLKAARSGTTGDHHDRWYIATEDIRTFLLANVEIIELSKLERVGSKMWFLELITGGRIAEHEEAAPVPLPGASAPPATAAPVAAGSLTSPDRTVALYGERVTLSALAEISSRSVATLLHRIDGLGLGVEDAAFGEETSGAATAPFSRAPVTPLGTAIGAGLAALMKKHRAKAEHVATWTAFPAPVIVAMLAGSLPMISPALLAAVETLDGEVTVTITPKVRSYDT